jgi:PAS domain S-box-containing protein
MDRIIEPQRPPSTARPSPYKSGARRPLRGVPMNGSDRAAAASILIVDDDPDIGQGLHDLLEHEGYRVRVTTTGRDALAAAQALHFDAVLLDLGLPDVDGLTVLKELHQLDAKVPVVILTAFTATERTVGSLAHGAFAYLTKPYNRDELRATLRRAVGVRALAVRAERVEDALSASEERFRSVVRSANDAIVIADGQGLIVTWNPAAERLFGFTAAEVLGQSLTLVMPARYREAHERGLERVRLTGHTRMVGQTVELHGLRKDGTEFPIELSLATWSTRDGLYYSGIIRDMTERKRAEEALRESEERLRLALDAGQLGIWDWDIQTGRVVWSDRVSQLFGRVLSSFPGSYEGYLSCIHQEDREQVTAAITAAIRHGGPYMIEHRVVWPNGAVRWMACRGQVRCDAAGRGIRMLGTVQDITEHKLSHEALRESQDRFRQLAENIREVFWLTDVAKNRIIYISPGYEEIWGRTCESLYDAPRSWLQSVHPEDQPRVQLEALTKQAAGDYDVEYRIVRPDGAIRWIRDRAFPIRDVAGSVYRIAGIAEDITASRTAAVRS